MTHTAQITITQTQAGITCLFLRCHSCPNLAEISIPAALQYIVGDYTRIAVKPEIDAATGLPGQPVNSVGIWHL